MHLHVESSKSEAKFWLEPRIELAVSYRFNTKELTDLRHTLEEHANAFRFAWKQHFPS